MSCAWNSFSSPRGPRHYAAGNLVHEKASGTLDFPYGSLSGNVTASGPGGPCGIFIECGKKNAAYEVEGDNLEDNI